MRAAACFLLIAAAAAGAAVAACSSFDSDGGAGPDNGEGGVVGPPDGAAPADADTDGLAACATTAPAPELVESPGGTIRGLTTDGAYVYWILNGQSIQRRAVGAGSIETIHVDVGQLSSIAVVPGYVAFVSSGTWIVPSVPDAGAATLLTGDLLLLLLANDTLLFGHGGAYIERFAPPATTGWLSTQESGVSALAVNGTKIFYVAPGRDAGPERAIYAVDNAPVFYQQPTLVFHATGTDPSKIAADATDLFLLDVAAEVVAKVPTTGGTSTTLAAGQPDLGNVAVRGDHVYYTTSLGLRRVPKAGGCWTAISNDAVQEFAVTAQYVYFARGTDLVRVQL